MNHATDILQAILRHIVALAAPESRMEAARAIAPFLDADDLIVFIRDPEVGRSLPALGFPQTLRDTRSWRALVDAAIMDGSAEGTIALRDGQRVPARAAGASDGTVLVLIGTNGQTAALDVAKNVLPLAGAFFRVEVAARRAETEAALARQSATEAGELATKLDITRAELQRALAVAETATRARDEFLATVSHELRTPLTSIIGWLQLLRGETQPEILSEAHETIERNARAQSRLIEDILDFSRINAGKLRLDVRPLDLVDVVGSAVEVVRPAADAKGLKLDVVLDPSAGFISGDPDRLQQVVWNLLSNAVKFTPRGGRVQVRLERVNSHVQITVSDTGPGISPEFLPFVFDRFSQAESGSTRTHGGLGLGLGIVKNLVELHGGTVQALSPGTGKGATFAVRLPIMVARDHDAARVSERAAPVAPVSEENDPGSLEGCAILVVEDNDDARKLLHAILSRAGATVETAENVSVALRILAAHRPDLIVSDIEMPGEDGYSFITKVRVQGSAHRRVPAIALTAYTRSVDRVRALAAGFQMHMAKPVEPAELVAAAKSLVAATSHAPGS
ncbi:MAG TPA: ATP-binding protein [Thermoanaerobaculia bacterium]|nr:ATP-binding protein [Thermoanaerobaculia bacterium]